MASLPAESFCFIHGVPVQAGLQGQGWESTGWKRVDQKSAIGAETPCIHKSINHTCFLDASSRHGSAYKS